MPSQRVSKARRLASKSDKEKWRKKRGHERNWESKREWEKEEKEWDKEGMRKSENERKKRSNERMREIKEWKNERK